MFKFIPVALLILSMNVFADTKIGIMGSLLYNSSDTEEVNGLKNVDEESKLSFGAGVRALMGINDQLHFRSGASLVQKKWAYEVQGLSGDVEASVLYLSIPLTLYWKASPQAGFFGGTNLQAKLDDDVETSGALGSSNQDLDAETLVLPFVLGFDFAFSESISMELSYELAIMDTSEDTKVSSGVVSLVYNLPN